MVEEGLENEGRALLDRGFEREIPVLKSVGYAETIRYLDGAFDREAWAEEIVVSTRRYAKRQRTWFRGLGGATWLVQAPDEAAARMATRVLAEFTRVK